MRFIVIFRLQFFRKLGVRFRGCPWIFENNRCPGIIVDPRRVHGTANDWRQQKDNHRDADNWSDGFSALHRNQTNV